MTVRQRLAGSAPIWELDLQRFHAPRPGQSVPGPAEGGGAMLSFLFHFNPHADDVTAA
jgi:hypothetical protein